MGDMLSEIFKTELFAVTEDGNSEKSEKNSFTVYPREKPTQSEKIGWINKWTDGLNGAGYSARASFLSTLCACHSSAKDDGVTPQRARFRVCKKRKHFFLDLYRILTGLQS